MNEAHEQYSLSDTIFNYIIHFGPPGNIYRERNEQVKKTYYYYYEAGRHVVGFEDSSIDVFLEVQIKDIVKYCM